MPYIHVTLAAGRSRAQKRNLIATLTDRMQQTLEVAREDIHVLLWELPTENIGEGGSEPAIDDISQLTVLMSKGRPDEVVLVLIKDLTDAVQEALQVKRPTVRVVVTELPFSRIGEGGIPMEPPRIPHWYYHQIASRLDQKSA